MTTVTFTEEEGRTLVTSVTLYPSRDIRDAVLQGSIRDAVLQGMDTGAAEIYDRFEEHLRTIA